MNGPDIAHAVDIARKIVADAARRVANRRGGMLQRLMIELAEEIEKPTEADGAR